MSREKVAAYLWPESDESRGRNSLKQAISVLRRELDPELFLSGTPGLRLNPDVIVTDLAEFERALEDGELDAVRLYQGPFLDGFHLGAIRRSSSAGATGSGPRSPGGWLRRSNRSPRPRPRPETIRWR